MAKKKVSKTGTTASGGASFQGGLQNPQGLFSVGAQKAGINKTGEFSVSQTSSFFYSPELTTESWLLPKSRQEILKWIRIFFNLEPYIQQITDMHAKYPFSKFEVVTQDESVKRFYEEMAFNENFDLFKFLLQASLSYQKFGEAIMFGTMEKGKDGYWRWSKFVLLEPELVEVRTDMMTGKQTFEMIPTEEIKDLVNSQKPEDQERKKLLMESSPEVVNAVLEHRNIRLDDTQTSMVARLTDPSATRGTSPIQSCFKVLIYQDWIRLAQSAFAQRYVFPVELWTIGDLQNNIVPDDASLEKWRNLLNQAVQNPPFTIVAPPYVKYEALSTLGKQFPINNEYEYIQDQLMVALGVNKNILLGEGPSFSNVKTMALHKLMMTYKVIRDEFENWMMYKFFKPIAEKNGFYHTSDGRKKLTLPEISWNKSLDIEEQEAEKEQFLDLHAKGMLSTKTLYTKFPSLDYEAEQKNLELERGTIWDKGDERIPAKTSKSLTKGKRPGGGGGSGGSGGGAGGMGAGPTPIRPIAPDEMGGEGETPELGAPAAPGIEGPTSPGTEAPAPTPEV